MSIGIMTEPVRCDFMITRAGVPEAIGLWLKEVLQSPAMFLLGVNAALFLIGMFIETSAAIIVLAPILAPVAMYFGVDPVHFGLIMVVNLALGMITPPFGVNLFAACTVARISLDRIIPHLVPFVTVVLACLMVITYVPEMSVWLRDLVYSRQYCARAAHSQPRPGGSRSEATPSGPQVSVQGLAFALIYRGRVTAGFERLSVRRGVFHHVSTGVYPCGWRSLCNIYGKGDTA